MNKKKLNAEEKAELKQKCKTEYNSDATIRQEFYCFDAYWGYTLGMAEGCVNIR